MNRIVQNNDQWGEFAKKKFSDEDLKLGVKLLQAVAKIAEESDLMDDGEFAQAFQEARENFSYNIDRLLKLMGENDEV